MTTSDAYWKTTLCFFLIKLEGDFWCRSARVTRTEQYQEVIQCLKNSRMQDGLPVSLVLCCFNINSFSHRLVVVATLRFAAWFK